MDGERHAEERGEQGDVGGGATVFIVGLVVTLALLFVAAGMVLGGKSFSGKFNYIELIDIKHASAHINNNATVGTVLGSGVPSGCPAGFRDAAAKTYAANDPVSTLLNDVNFGIVFI